MCGNLIFWTACLKSFCFYSCKSNLNRIPPTRFSTPDRFLTDNWNIWPRLTRTPTTSLTHRKFQLPIPFSLTWLAFWISLSLIFVWASLSLVNFTPGSMFTNHGERCWCCGDNIVLPGSHELLSSLLFSIWTPPPAPFLCCGIFCTQWRVLG